MRHKKSVRAAAGFLLLLMLFSGCGASTAKSGMPQAASTAAYAADSAQNAQMESTATAQASGGTATVSPEQMAAAQSSRKIIYNASLEMEALEFGAVCARIAEAVKEAGGYLSYTDKTQPSSAQSLRYATYECRVPVEAYDAFLQAMGSAGNVVSQSATAQDITSEYVDVEARLESLRLQEERLLAMMEKAGDLDTLLAIQNQLTEVQYQLESYTAQQRTYDDLIAYCTVTVSVQEVRQETPTTDDFAARVGAAFVQGWQSFGIACQNVAIWFVGAFPGFLAAAVVVAAVWVAVRAQRKRKQRKSARQGQENAAGIPVAPATLTTPTPPVVPTPPTPPTAKH